MKAFTSLAASVALAATTLLPAPAMADNDQGERLARLLFGIATVAIIASAVNGQNRNNNDNSNTHPPQPQPSAHLLPHRCWAVYPTTQGPKALMNADCLTRNYRLARRLPVSCAITIRTRGGFESGFEPQCLRRNGFVLPPR